MTRHVLLLGLKGVIVDDVVNQLDIANLDVHGGTGIEDLRAAFAAGSIDHVIMGAGLDIDTRLTIIRETFRLSETTTVHMRGRASGPEGFLPFVRAVLTGLMP